MPARTFKMPVDDATVTRAKPDESGNAFARKYWGALGIAGRGTVPIVLSDVVPKVPASAVMLPRRWTTPLLSMYSSGSLPVVAYPLSMVIACHAVALRLTKSAVTKDEDEWRPITHEVEPLHAQAHTHT